MWNEVIKGTEIVLLASDQTPSYHGGKAVAAVDRNKDRDGKYMAEK